MSDSNSSFEKNVQDGIKQVEVKKNLPNPIVPVEIKSEPLDPNKLGYNLVKIALFIVAGFLILLMLAIVFYKRLDVSANLSNAYNLSNSLKIDSKELLSMYIQERDNEREFILKISQIVLLNLLLPIITAIVGFIFGAKSLSSRNAE